MGSPGLVRVPQGMYDIDMTYNTGKYSHHTHKDITRITTADCGRLRVPKAAILAKWTYGNGQHVQYEKPIFNYR